MTDRYRIYYQGRELLVEATVHGPDPSVGILYYWSDGHVLLDPDTEVELSDAEQNAFTDDDWEKIGELFDEQIDPTGGWDYDDGL